MNTLSLRGSSVLRMYRPRKACYETAPPPQKKKKTPHTNSFDSRSCSKNGTKENLDHLQRSHEYEHEPFGY